MEIPAVNTHNINVTFDQERNVQLDGLAADRALRVGNGIGVIFFSLRVGEERVRFPSNPITWTKADLPVSQPDCFQVYRVSDDLFVVIDYNFESATYGFQVLVSDDGALKVGDPTIINEPPGGAAS